MNQNMIQQQRVLCERYGSACEPPAQGTRVGVALPTLRQIPLNGMRIRPEGSLSGWFIWAGGEPSQAEDFYDPLCVEHMAEYCPLALPFLALPPGWRFLTDGDYVDVWFDPELLKDSV